MSNQMKAQISSLKASYLNELYKIAKKKKIIVAGILSLAAVAVAALIVGSMKNFAGINVVGSSEFSIIVLSVLNYTLIPLFTAFICIDMFGGEFTEHTIKLTLTRPVSRFKIFLAKTLAAATFILANLLFVMVISLIGTFIIGTSKLSVLDIIITYLVSFFPLMVFALMAILLSNLMRGTVSAFLLTVILYLVMLGVGLFNPAAQSFFFTTAFDWYILFLGSFFNVQKVLRVFCILMGYGLAFFSLGYLLFDRRDI